MANSIAVVFGPQPAGIGNKHVYVVSASIDTYASGGIAITVPASITKPIVFVQASGGYGAEWDATNGKVILYAEAGTEVTTLSSAVAVTLLFIGQ
jgi:hypothetical protein